MSPPRVDTTTGALYGRTVRGVHRFLGIPYAVPPVGALRFRPTRPIAHWHGELQADRFGPASIQVYDPHEGELAEFLDAGETFDPRTQAVGAESSLTLNVWTPGLGSLGLDGAGRPVIVWIHGGANWLESSRLSVYDGEALARRGEAVFVSLNYRLGVFGFLDLTPLGEDAPVSAHANGLHDQLTALRWVAANARAFGGDPDRITLMGGSAGSMDITWLMASGALDGLVRRVVLMSGVASVAGVGHDGSRSVHTLDEGERRAAGFFEQAGFSGFEELSQAPATEIVARHEAVVARSDVLFDMDTLFFPRVDGGFLPADPFARAAAGALAGFDVLVGFTEYEMGLWLAWDDALDRRPPEAYAPRLPFLPDAARAHLAEAYAKALPACAPGVRSMHLLGDAMFVMPSLLFAELLARHNPNVWVYDFALGFADTRRGALHAADQAFFFDTRHTPSARLLIGEPQDAAAHARLSRDMQDALLSFARTGVPAAWPRYGAERQLTRLDASESAVVADPFGARREFWFTEAYRKYVPP